MEKMGSLTLAYPSIAGKTTQEQLDSMRRYLCGLTQQLNLADWSARATLTEISQAIDAESLTQQEKKTTLSGYAALRSLIIKTADYAAANSETWSTKLSGSYVALSDFGKYVEQTQLTLSANEKGIEQLYDYTAGVNSKFAVTSRQYIKTGLLYYDDVTPVYGVGVGNLETTVTDGGEQVIDKTQNELLTVTPGKLSFWQEGQEVAYVSGKKLHFPSGTLEAAGAVLSGTITAAAGSSFGPWTISQSSIYRVANEFGGSASMYFGTNGLSISNTFKVDASGKLTCTGAEIGGTINATDLRLDGTSVQSKLRQIMNEIEIISDGLEIAGTNFSNGTIGAANGSLQFTASSSATYAVDLSGPAVRIRSTSGAVYLQNAAGTAYIQLGADGTIKCSASGGITGLTPVFG